MLMQKPDKPAVFDNTLIATVLSATFLGGACWLVTAIACTHTLTYWVDNQFTLLQRSKKVILTIFLDS